MRDKWMEREKEIERGRDKEREKENASLGHYYLNSYIFLMFGFFSPFLVSGVKQGLSEEEEEEEETSENPAVKGIVQSR
jgi:hypothetical protein